MILLDTSAVIELLKGTEKGNVVRTYIGAETVGMTTITVNEVLIGALGKQHEIALGLIESAEILPFDLDAAHKSVEVEQFLRKKGKLVGKLDIFIAAIGLVHNLSLLTTDEGFKNVQDLKVILV